MLQDLRLALRFLVRRPGFSAVVIVTISMAICINATVFTAVNAVLFRPLPFDDPDRLLRIVTSRAGADARPLSYSEIAAYQSELAAIESVGWYFRQPEDRFDLDALVRFVSIPVLSNFFDVLGVEAAIGRTFLPEETSNSRVVVISHSFWQRRFGRRADVAGQTLRFDGAAYLVIGVMPPSFHHVDGLVADVWTPIWPMPSRTARRDWVIGRLRPGASLQQAQAQADVVASRLEPLHPESNTGWRARLEPLNDAIAGDVQDAALVLLFGVVIVLLIACVNVGNMLLARNLARWQEFRVRLALGAGRTHLLRQAVAESVMLAVVGGLAGIMLTLASVDVLVKFAPRTLPRLAVASIDGRVWLWAVSIILAAGALAGLLPALAVSRLRSVERLGDTSRVSPDRQARSLAAAVVVAEVALATLLVISAGLMVRTLTNLRQTDLGFRPSQILTIYLRPSWGASSSGPNMALLYQELRERIASVPGVLGVGAAKGLPLTSYVRIFDVHVTTEYIPAGQNPVTASSWVVVPGYFEALGIPLRKGRYFVPADDVEAHDVAVVSSELARHAFGEQDPIGRRVTVGAREATVVGVVGDIRTSPGMPPKQTVYLTGSNASARLAINLAVRVEGDPAAIAPRIRDEILGHERNVAIVDISTLGEALESSLGYPRFLTLMLNIFGTSGLLLAAIGIYGLGSYSVAQRRQEIGVRMAVGADRAAIMRLVVSRGLWLVAIGTLLGTMAALATTKFLSALLFGVSSTDPLTLVATALILLFTAACASYVPAHRASCVDLAGLLRSD